MKFNILILLLTWAPVLFGVEHYTVPENKPLKLPFSDAVRVENTVYLSGAIGVQLGTADLVTGGIEAETHQTMKNIGTILKHFGLGYEHIVRCQIILEDMGDWPSMNKVYASYFSGDLPARSALGSSGLALRAKVEMECIAVIPDRG